MYNGASRNISPWVTRRKPGTRNVFEVVSFNECDGDVVIAKEFKNLERAQEFAMEANLMIGRGGESVKNI